MIDLPSFFSSPQTSVGPLLISLKSDGFQIKEAVAEFGFAHRGLLARISSEHWIKNKFVWAHIAPDTAPVVEKLFSETVEQGMRVHVPERAIHIRNLMVSLSECSRMMRCLSGCFRSLEMRPAQNLVVRMREEIIDLFELMTGSRHGYYFIVPGGVRWDVSEGFLARLDSWASSVRPKFELVNEFVRLSGIANPNLKKIGRISYWKNGAYGLEKSVLDRMQIMADQLLIEVSKLKKIVSELPTSAVLAPISPTEGAVETEWLAAAKEEFKITHSGICGDWILAGSFSNAGKVSALRLQTPSDVAGQWISEALLGVEPVFVELVLESLDICTKEVDQ